MDSMIQCARRAAVYVIQAGTAVAVSVLVFHPTAWPGRHSGAVMQTDIAGRDDGVVFQSPSPDGSRAAMFGVTNDGGQMRRGLFVKDPSRGGMPAAWRLLAAARANSAEMLFPVWAPDNRHIAFCRRLADAAGHRRSVLFTADADTSEVRALTKGDRAACTDASYSPDGRWIAFSRTAVGGRDICVIPADGGKTITLTGPEARRSSAVRPEWSDDGRTIRYRRSDGMWGSVLFMR